LPFLAGTYRSLAHGRLALRAAFKMEGWLSRRRNDGVEPELHLPATRVVSKAATTRLFPGIQAAGLTGGAQWYEYQVLDSDRFALALAAGADRAGADLANYLEAFAALRDGRRLAGMRARDQLSGREVKIRASAVVNAAGARVGPVMTSLGATRHVTLVSTIDLVTSKPASDMALVAPVGNGQVLALVPWRGRATVGPWHDHEANAARKDPAARLDALLGQANTAFPALGLTRGDVTGIEHALVPAVGGGPETTTAGGFEVLDHATDGVENAVTLLGAGFMSARAAAERAVDALAKKLGRRLPRSRTAATVLPGAGIADHEALAIETARELRFEVDPAVIRHLIARYAEDAAAIIRLMKESHEWERPVAPGAATISAEIVYAARAEMGTRLTDIVVRRTGLAAGTHPGPDALRTCARIAAGELGWDLAREAEEIRTVDRRFEPGG
jgi:glycerol-3-phosphate dehydrogenase